MVLSDCLVDLSLQTDTPNMYVGTIFNIPESTYSLKITYQKCDGALITDNYATMEIRKSGALIGVHDFHPGGDPVLFDNNTLCIALGVFECQPIDPSQWWTAYRVGYNPDLCLNVSCPDQCYGSDLWSMKCDPATGLCIQDALKQSNSPICSATNYIDIHIRPNSWYSPQGAADEIVTKLVDIDGAIVNIFSDILDYQYLGTTIYSTSTEVVIRINLKQISTAPAPMQTLVLPLLAKIGIIIIIILSIIILIGIITKWNFGAVEKTYTKEEVGTLINDTIKEIDKNCETNFASDPVGYALCVKSAIGGSTTTLGDFLNDPTITDAGNQAGQQIDACIAQYKIDLDIAKLNECVNGQVTDVTNKIKKATTPEQKEDCWIPAPLGGCILTASTGKTIALIGGVVIGGILIISLVKK
jgi:hypothetical protein